MTSTADETAVSTAIAAPNRNWRDDARLVTSPIQIHSRADMASILRAHRIALGMTNHDLDHEAGFHDGYSAKMEHGDKPSGRKGYHFREPDPADPADGGDLRISFNGEIWPETMGLAFVLMPAELARSIGAVPAPKREQT